MKVTSGLAVSVSFTDLDDCLWDGMRCLHGIKDLGITSFLEIRLMPTCRVDCESPGSFLGGGGISPALPKVTFNI